MRFYNEYKYSFKSNALSNSDTFCFKYNCSYGKMVMSERIIIQYQPIKQVWQLIGHTGQSLYESFSLDDVQQFRKNLINDGGDNE